MTDGAARNGSGLVALVTGANKGIGFEVARALAKDGVVVYLGARQAPLGEAAAATLRAEGLDVGFVLLDVTDAQHVVAAARRIEDEHGRLDILVNNAAIGLDFTAPSQVALESVRAVFETNTFAPIAVIQAMLPLLRQSPAGRIVNVSSDFGSLTLNSNPKIPHGRNASLAYPASKAALNHVTVQLAKELRGTTVKINSVDPGFTDTDMIAVMGIHPERKPAQAAVPIVRLALVDGDGPSGGFFNEDGPLPW